MRQNSKRKILPNLNNILDKLEYSQDGISSDKALAILEIPSFDSFIKVLGRTSSLRERYFNLSACSIVNARCGICSEDCAFCAQSSRSTAKIRKYQLLDEKILLKNAVKAELSGASHYSIVCSGRMIDDKNLDKICKIIEKIRETTNIGPCASLGILNGKSLKKLKNAGLKRYHHNIETSRSFFKNICTTRSYDSQIETVLEAKSVGLELCSGGLFGLGETKSQRIELLNEIRSLKIDSIPLNFLNPAKGTPLEHLNELTPLECLKIIACARLMMPDKSIRVCGGREHNLRDFQSWIFAAGANAFMIGGYLVTPGRSIKDDLQMIKDAGMKLEKER